MIRGETKSLPGVAGHKAKDDGVLAGRCSLYSSFHVFSLWLFFSLAMFSGFFSVFFFSHPLTLSVFFSLMFILVPPLSIFVPPWVLCFWVLSLVSCVWSVSFLLGLGHQKSCHGRTVGDGF